LRKSFPPRLSGLVYSTAELGAGHRHRARTRRGIIVPIVAWALLIVGAVMLALSFP
jgi:hypothetical protein